MNQPENDIFQFDLLKADQVAKMFHTTQQKLKAAILNHTLPIGFVAEGDVDRIFIVKKRLEAYLNANDLSLSKNKCKERKT